MKRGISDEGMKRIAQVMGDDDYEMPGEESWRRVDPQIRVVGRVPKGTYAVVFIELKGKSLEEVQAEIDAFVEEYGVEEWHINDAEGFGAWDNMEDEPLEVIMDAVQAIEERGVDDYYRTGI